MIREGASNIKKLRKKEDELEVETIQDSLDGDWMMACINLSKTSYFSMAE